ncbi:MAG: 1-deoxy-D-xylulose-5-phosphate reductoisomerase, partial [Treponemataceae bacterium]|nr:1-deoxy-D-xylulose-5-phosphate reductoisomerase [Treponemataceae bacterium]
PLLRLAFDAARNDNAYPIAFNAANEIAAWAFIDGHIGFTDLARIVESVMGHDWSGAIRNMPDVLAADTEARAQARAAL